MKYPLLICKTALTQPKAGYVQMVCEGGGGVFVGMVWGGGS